MEEIWRGGKKIHEVVVKEMVAHMKDPLNNLERLELIKLRWGNTSHILSSVLGNVGRSNGRRRFEDDGMTQSGGSG